AGAMGLAEGVAAGGERNGLFVIHRHPLERDLDVAGGPQWVWHASGALRIDANEAHLDRCQRVLELHVAFGLDAGLLSRNPLLLGAPVDVAFGLEHILAAAAKAEDRPAHRFDG